jgi:hypothetical protein
VERSGAIPCVIYAAKSSADQRGSIPEQLRECREAIEADPRRHLIASYNDEAVSAFRRSRGPELAGAMEHAEALASEHGEAELWALHSDRLARGDGRSARHAVEIALWALKRDVKVRTLQDPDTFRDLLYAVVTGQRNHEDSRRKGLASAAGRRRAAERGQYTGAKPDGYRRAITISQSGAIEKRLEIDPERRAVVELIFAMALRRRGTGEIARALAQKGFLTKPLARRQRPKPWTVHAVRELLSNPRYAGLSVYGGEVLARGNWPAYITEAQHRRIKERLRKARPRRGPSRHEPYLLARLARCGRCGSSMHCVTGELRVDGTFARRYVCRSHNWERHEGRCAAAPLDADVAEAMFASAIGLLLIDRQAKVLEPAPGGALPPARCASAREELLIAVRDGEDRRIDAALQELFSRSWPEAAMLGRIAESGRAARQLELARRVSRWASEELAARSEATRAQTRELNRLLRQCFSAVELSLGARSLQIRARRRSSLGGEQSAEVRFDRREWIRWSPVAQRTRRIYTSWEPAEILGALQAWADVHGQAPHAKDWRRASQSHPSDNTVRRHFGGFRRAVVKAGLQPRTPALRTRWSDAEIITALRRWAERHGRPPCSEEWRKASLSRPSPATVYNHFDGWHEGLRAAGLDPEKMRVAGLRWSDEEILAALKAWAELHGRAPARAEWFHAASERPNTTTVARHFGGWRNGLRAAGLA